VSKKAIGQLTIAVALLKDEMREVKGKIDTIDSEIGVLFFGMFLSVGFMLGYIVANMTAK
jgi:hypothetical protein